MAIEIKYDDPDSLLFILNDLGIGENGWQTPHTISIFSDGEVKAVTAYERFSETSCNMHITSDKSKKWLNREFLFKCFAYPFIQLRLNRVTILVPENNLDAIRFDTHIGFTPEGVLRESMEDGSDLMLFGMLRRECRFIPKEFRK